MQPLRWFLRGLGGFAVGSAVVIAFANLGWDVWAWHDRATDSGERRFFRMVELADAIDYGLAEVVIINETDKEFLIDALVLDAWGGTYTHQTSDARTIARAGQQGATRVERRRLDRLVGEGLLELNDAATGRERRSPLIVDRRRPISCRVEVRLRETGETVSDCRVLAQVRTDYRWLFGPPLY